MDKVRRLVLSLESLNPSKDSEKHKFLRKANDVFQTSIARVKELFEHMLIENKQNIEHGVLSFWANEDDGDDSDDDQIQRDGMNTGFEVCNVDLINPR